MALKIKWNERYNTISLYAFIVIALSIIFYLIASEVSMFQIKVNEAVSTFMPFIIGFVMAYLFNFILKFYEEIVLNFKAINNMKRKRKRSISILLTYITVILVSYLFVNFVFPQLLSSVVGLANDIPTYVKNVTQLFIDISENLDISEEYYSILVQKWDEAINYIIRFATDFIPILGNAVKSTVSSIWNIVLGIIISTYLLMDKERFFGLSKKTVIALFSEKTASKIIELTHRSNIIFGKFIGGKLLDSFIIGILTFVVISIFNMPYTILIAFIIAITNVIPFFGPFIGAIPSAIIILFVSPIKALWFLLIIVIIQQIDGNIIGPKILGDSLGISAFWILFSLLITGKIFGFIGLIIGVPLFAIIYSIVKDFVESRLKKKELPTDTKDYM